MLETKHQTELPLKSLSVFYYAWLMSVSLAVLGCGEAKPKTFKVSGMVSFVKKPLSEGTITFEDSSIGIAEALKIELNGSYSANLPEGTYGVSIQPPMVTVAATATSEGGDEFKKVGNIPVRYRSAFESKLKVKVSGDAVFDVEMVK